MSEEINTQTQTDDDTLTADSGAAPSLICSITNLAMAQALPEVGEDAATEPVEFAPGAIEQFASAADGNRTMRIVGFAGGLAAQVVQPAAVDEQTE